MNPIAGYYDQNAGQHVNFIDGSGPIRELYLATGKSWECNDLTAAA